MDADKLMIKFSKFGQVKICKADYVFTLLIIGENLSKSQVMMEIMDIMVKTVSKEYPYIEATSNGANYFCTVLKKQA